MGYGRIRQNEHQHHHNEKRHRKNGRYYKKRFKGFKLSLPVGGPVEHNRISGGFYRLFKLFSVGKRRIVFYLRPARGVRDLGRNYAVYGL